MELAQVGWLVGVMGIVMGCGPGAGAGAGAATDAATTDTETGGGPLSETSGEEPGFGDASSGTSAPDTGEVSDTGMGTTGSRPPEPEVICESNACDTECASVSVVDAPDGGWCTCDAAPAPRGYVKCDVGTPCDGEDRICQMQALRYGVVSTLTLHPLEGMDDFDEIVIDVLGPGLARGRHVGWSHGCCEQTSVDEYGVFGHPRSVRGTDDPFWDECVAVVEAEPWKIADCFEADAWGLDGCEGLLPECAETPVPIPPGAPCEAACPMANDGVCDEAQGTGLCPAGCDPLDCTCAEDLPGECDEAIRGGTCPLGSDPDC